MSNEIKKKELAQIIAAKTKELGVIIEEANQMGITVEINNTPSSINMKQGNTINLKIYSIVNYQC
ncbi:MAG: hypothetical protein WCG82_08370 [Bacteroidota bacterium]